MKVISLLRSKILAFRQDPLYMNSIFMMASTAMVSGSGFFFWMFATHLYPAYQIGLATAIISVIVLIMNLSNLGFNYSSIRYLPKARNRSRLLSTIVLMISSAAAMAALIFLSFLSFLSPNLSFIRENPVTFVAFILFAVFIAVDFATEGFFLALRKGKFIFLKNIGIVALKFLLPLLFIPFGAFGLFMAWATAISSALIVSGYVLFKHYGFRFIQPFKKINIKQLMTFSFTNYVVTLTGIVPGLILPVVIANVINVEAAAYFYISFMIANLLYTIPNAITQSLFAEGSHNISTFLQSIKKAFKLLTAILLPAILVLLVFGHFILFVFGKSYSTEGVKFLQLLAIAGLPIALNAIGLTILNLKHLMKPLLIINLTGAAVILILSYLLRELALTGIGIAWLIGHSVKSVLYAGYILLNVSRVSNVSKAFVR